MNSVSLIFTFLVSSTIALNKCNKNLTTGQFCKLTDEYPSFPFVIQPTIDILDIIDVNDDQKTITLYFQLLLAYNETASILVENPKNLLDGWYEIDKTIHPDIAGKQLSLNFINALSIKKASIYGEDGFEYFWHAEPHYKEYAELIQETLTCDFQFHTFPFDEHECYLRFHNPHLIKAFLILTPTKIYVHSKSTNISQPALNIDNSRLPYVITVESIEPSMTQSTIYDYVNSGLKFKLQRRSIGQLLGGYFGPTAIFALLSLISFIINPDIVSFTKLKRLGYTFKPEF